MHIVENWNASHSRKYCYAAECNWNKELGVYEKPRISIGHVEGDPPTFIPNESFSAVLSAHPSHSNEKDRLAVAAVIAKYGESVLAAKPVLKQRGKSSAVLQTAQAVFTGPSCVFGGITKRYKVDEILRKAFGEDVSRDILSLAWYLASEGSALNNSDAWLDCFDTPRGCAISSQDITRLLDSMGQDGIMTFYKDWLASLEKTDDKVLYDLTSISWYGEGINLANWGYNRDKENLPQVNFAMLCVRSTGMPLFAWLLEGSISDVNTLKNTLQFLSKLDYKPNCLMMDRAFDSQENISYMLRHNLTFLQALKLNANWVRAAIDATRQDRLHPDSMYKTDNRTYYVSTVKCRWVALRKTTKNGVSEEVQVHILKDGKANDTASNDGEDVIFKRSCCIHVLFCQDLVGGHWDKFMEELKNERERLLANEKESVDAGLKRYFIIERKKYARHRTVDFNMEQIEKHRNNYAGHVCFITNDKSIPTAVDALREYSTRDYLEKDFDEMKNDVDMKRIRVHTDNRMPARLLIQFIAEIIHREIRVRLRNSDFCKKMTKKQISAHIKSIYKIKFKGKYKDVKPELSKSQKAILEALDIADNR